MIQFVNAKINIGLQIVSRRPDGYHDLQTIFYPVGLHNGTVGNPAPFCDILEVVAAEQWQYSFSGRSIDCPPEKNLVCRACELFRGEAEKRGFECPEFAVSLEKHLPDGAGLGGGSADASFLLRALNELTGSRFSAAELEAMALRLGADCPVFISNAPAYGEGVGERLTPLPAVLEGMWCAIVKPDVYVSTREAFSGITPHPAFVDLREVYRRPVAEWRGLIVNDFEAPVSKLHPRIAEVKEQLYAHGALYASMSGSGSALYGIFADRVQAAETVASGAFSDCFSALCRL